VCWKLAICWRRARSSRSRSLRDCREALSVPRKVRRRRNTAIGCLEMRRGASADAVAPSPTENHGRG
jgi:hypothetical protein